MDRISCLAYVLYQSTEKSIQEIAIALVSGELTLIEIKKNKTILPQIEAAEKFLHKNDLNADEVYNFIEEFLYVT